MDHDHEDDVDVVEDTSDFEDAHEQLRPRDLPTDLPRSLDDRKTFAGYNDETEMYDAWQGVYTYLLLRWLLVSPY